MAENSILLEDRYQILGHLAQGSQYSVFRGFDTWQNIEVVLKQAHHGEAESLIREYRLLWSIRHPNIIQTIDLIHTEGKTFLVQSFASGEDFVSWASHNRSPIRICLGWAAALRSLDFLHGLGIIHRDIKPSHLRIGTGKIGNLPELRVIDFGLATSTPSAGMAGTLAFAAPEVLAGEPATPMSDLYSLGVVLFIGLLGYAPFREWAYPVGELKLPDNFQHGIIGDLLKDLLHPNPIQRPSMITIWESLEQIVGRSVRLSLEELKGDYWPTPPTIGRVSVLNHIEQTILQVKNHKCSRAICLTGGGKRAVIQGACVLGKIYGLKIISLDQLLSLLKPGNMNPTEQTFLGQCIAKAVDTIIQQANHLPILLHFDGQASYGPLVFKTALQLIRLLLQNQTNTGGDTDEEQTGEGYLLICTDELSPSDSAPWEVIHLPPLDPAQTSTLLKVMLNVDENPEWVEEIYPMTGGDPRLIVDLVRVQIEAGLPEQLALSIDRNVLIEHRWRSLSPIESGVLNVIVLSLRPIPLRVLKQVIKNNIDALPSLMKKGYITVEERGVFVPNLLLKQIIQKSIPDEISKEIHQQLSAAWSLEENSDPLAMGHHLIGGGKVIEGVDLLMQNVSPLPDDLEHALKLLPPEEEKVIAIQRYLAKFAQANGNLHQALHYIEAMEKTHAEEASILRGEILLNAGKPKEALEVLTKVKNSSRLVRLFLAQAYFYQGNYASALDQLRLGREIDDNDSLHAFQMDHLAGLSLIYLGNIIDGLALLKQTEKKLRQRNAPETLARVLNSQGIAHQRLGHIEMAIHSFKEALFWAKAIGDFKLSASTTINLGTLAQRQNNFVLSLQYFRKAARYAFRGQINTTYATALCNEANLLLFFGDFEQAQIKFEEAERIATESGALTLVGHIRLFQAELCLLQGQRDRAAHFIQIARSHFDTANIPAQEALDIQEIKLAISRKEWSTAQNISEKLLAQMSWKNPDRFRVHVLLGNIWMHLNSSELNRALQELEFAVALMRNTNTIHHAWEAYALMAQAFHRMNHHDEAAFYANQFYVALDEIRRKIPLPWRVRFDTREDVLLATEQVKQVKKAESTNVLGAEEYQRLLKINQELNRTVSLEHLFDQILEASIELTHAQRGFVLFKKNSELTIQASRNMENQTSSDEVEAFSRTIAQGVMEREQLILSANATEDIRFKEGLSIAELNIRSVLCVPLTIQGKVSGVLYLDHLVKNNVFELKHLHLLEAFADQAGIALETNRLLQESREQQKVLADINIHLENKVHQQSQEIQTISTILRAHEEEFIKQYNDAKIIGRSRVMRALFLKMEKIAPLDLPVHIYGESGTGKELVARTIHCTSSRKECPFVSVNCAAIPPHLLESEFFGHVKGAFTGAVRDRPGLFEIAGEGTLFLDEIGEMPLDMQSKLLRVLQDGSYQRVGDSVNRSSQCRIISASNKLLSELVEQKLFRQDLFYRINVFTLVIPPLRERREDIPLLIDYFLSIQKKPVCIAKKAIAALMEYDWPGNVRQLEHELQRSSVLCDGCIDIHSLSIPIKIKSESMTSLLEPRKERAKGLVEAIRDYEQELIEIVLKETDYNVSLAAKRLQMNRSALHRKMRQLGIKRKEP